MDPWKARIIIALIVYLSPVLMLFMKWWLGVG